jgi:hypothetical protein
MVRAGVSRRLALRRAVWAALLACSAGVGVPVGAAGAAAGRADELVEADAATGASHPAEPLPAPPEACNDAATWSQVAAIGRNVIVLIPSGVSGTSVLYRAGT